MTLTERRVARPPVKEAPPRPVRTPVRWLGWVFGLLVVAAGATLVVLAMLGGGESFEELYEAESGLALGEIHAPGYVAPARWVGESDGSLEDFELRQAIREAFGETRDSTRFAPAAAAAEFELREAIREAFGETRDSMRFVPAPAEPTAPVIGSYESPDWCTELIDVGFICIR